MKSKELFGVERAYGLLYFINNGFESRDDHLVFVEAQDVANVSLITSREYSQVRNCPGCG